MKTNDLINSLRRWGPSTTNQLAERLGFHINSTSAALCRLYKLGKVNSKIIKGNKKIWSIK